MEAYKFGGYHPVHLGEIYNKKYLVVEKMGWGHFSTVWMCSDMTAPANKPVFVAMKVQKSAPHYRDAAYDEIELLTCTKAASEALNTQNHSQSGTFNQSVVQLLDHFDHTGPNGKHVCMIFELLGENLLKVIKNYDYQGMSIPIVQNITRQICLGLDFLHRRCDIIHTDLKPENILIGIPPPTPSEVNVRALQNFASSGSASLEARKGKGGGAEGRQGGGGEEGVQQEPSEEK